MTADHLQRFLDAQAPIYKQALDEIRAGKKVSHWMWFIFPQLRGLGKSQRAHHYGIANFAEAKAYCQHPILGKRLQQACDALVQHIDEKPMCTTANREKVVAIFGKFDAMKLHSSLTLFYYASKACDDHCNQHMQSEDILLLLRYYFNNEDKYTMNLLRQDRDFLATLST